MKRIAILVNKDFEYSGFIEGLRDTVQVYAGTNGRDAECRFDNLIADIYCIQNLFSQYENSSNSEHKYELLNKLFKSNAFRLDELDGILSFSSAESTPVSQKDSGFDSRNGCVYVGNKFYLSDQRDNDPTTQSYLDIGSDKTKYATKYTEYYMESPICSNLYTLLNKEEMKMKIAPNNPAYRARCFANLDYVSVGVVNVMNYSCYKKADEDAYNGFMDNPFVRLVGIETTHGVVVKALNETCKELDFKKDIPVNFISPIVDRYLKFDEDVDGKYGKQNFICSYNGGVVTGHMLKILNENM